MLPLEETVGRWPDGLHGSGGWCLIHHWVALDPPVIFHIEAMAQSK